MGPEKLHQGSYLTVLQSRPADHYTMWLINICLASVCIGCYTGWQIHCVHGCRGLHLIFIFLVVHVTAMFLLSVECRFQRYQGWPGLTKSNGAGTFIGSQPPINTQPEVAHYQQLAEWPSGLRIEFILWRMQDCVRVRVPIRWWQICKILCHQRKLTRAHSSSANCW